MRSGNPLWVAGATLVDEILRGAGQRGSLFGSARLTEDLVISSHNNTRGNEAFRQYKPMLIMFANKYETR